MSPSAHRRSLPRLLRAVLVAAGGGLVAFHGLLLWQRLADGSLLQPVVAMRWGGAFLLVAGFVALWRNGASLTGRRARTLWVLVLALHAVPALPGGAESLLADGRDLLSVLPAVAAVFAALGWSLLRPGALQAACPTGLTRLAQAPLAVERVLARALAPRAPPLSISVR